MRNSDREKNRKRLWERLERMSELHVSVSVYIRLRCVGWWREQDRRGDCGFGSVFYYPLSIYKQVSIVISTPIRRSYNTHMNTHTCTSSTRKCSLHCLQRVWWARKRRFKQKRKWVDGMYGGVRSEEEIHRDRDREMIERDIDERHAESVCRWWIVLVATLCSGTFPKRSAVPESHSRKHWRKSSVRLSLSYSSKILLCVLQNKP
jgi:hypothetical protein